MRPPGVRAARAVDEWQSTCPAVSRRHSSTRVGPSAAGASARVALRRHGPATRGIAPSDCGACRAAQRAVIADDQCFGTCVRFLPASLLRRESGGRFDGSAFEQVGSGQLREPGVGAGAGEVDGQLLCESCDLG